MHQGFKLNACLLALPYLATVGSGHGAWYIHLAFVSPLTLLLVMHYRLWRSSAKH